MSAWHYRGDPAGSSKEDPVSTVSWTIIALAVAMLIAVAIQFLRPMLRRRRLRDRFGPEYDRVVEESGGRRAGERELTGREHRHADLHLRELAPDRQEHYRTRWAEVQQQFVDDPADATRAADQLVTTIMAERGYPIENYDQRLADLSVEHSTTLGHYRAAHHIATRPTGTVVSTEDRRTALVHYRALFRDLLDSDAHNQHK
ncbi:hypothetical protein [Nocardia tengchongensis]|uniref:hypothetical protein n=1 Tax=Nocardia tengchongensis TaxID=2055889 RepID=UPI00361B7D70